MGVFGGASHGSKEIPALHDCLNDGQINGFRLVQANSDHHHYKYLILVSWYLRMKYAVVHEYLYTDTIELLLQQVLYDVPHLTGIVPFVLLFIGV